MNKLGIHRQLISTSKVLLDYSHTKSANYRYIVCKPISSICLLFSHSTDGTGLFFPPAVWSD